MCADLPHHEGSIPEGWRKRVVRILRRNDRGTVIWKERPRHDAESLFPALFLIEIQAKLASIIDAGKIIDARMKITMGDAGETYEFLFDLEKRNLYSKINLTPEGKVIIIYSFHIPERDTL